MGFGGFAEALALNKKEFKKMKITDEFIERLKLQRNLQSVISNSVVLARTLQKLQKAVDEIQLKVGVPRGNDE